jgi:hypothetical protein
MLLVVLKEQIWVMRVWAGGAASLLHVCSMCFVSALNRNAIDFWCVDAFGWRTHYVIVNGKMVLAMWHETPEQQARG